MGYTLLKLTPSFHHINPIDTPSWVVINKKQTTYSTQRTSKCLYIHKRDLHPRFLAKPGCSYYIAAEQASLDKVCSKKITSKHAVEESDLRTKIEYSKNWDYFNFCNIRQKVMTFELWVADNENCFAWRKLMYTLCPCGVSWEKLEAVVEHWFFPRSRLF